MLLEHLSEEIAERIGPLLEVPNGQAHVPRSGRLTCRGLVILMLFAASGAAAQGAQAQEMTGIATHYGASYDDGRHGLGCVGMGVYVGSDPTIAGVQYPEHDLLFPCGSQIEVSGPGGTIIVTRRDSCPGCRAQGKLIDLSEAGIAAVCYPGASTCEVIVSPYRP